MLLSIAGAIAFVGYLINNSKSGDAGSIIYAVGIIALMIYQPSREAIVKVFLALVGLLTAWVDKAEKDSGRANHSTSSFGGKSSHSISSFGNTFNNPNSTKNPIAIADVRVRNNNYLETYDERGKSVKGMFLLNNEELVGFSQNFFITVSPTSNYLTTYNAQCKKINGMFLVNNERYHGCAGNTFTTKSMNTYISTYNLNCKKISGNFAMR